jgi:type VI secretion system protein ImpA
MSTEQPRIEDLLDPISEVQPGGVNLRWTPEWDRIKEARRSDDGLEAGQWEKRERKSANWRLVEELTFTALHTKTKDLQLAMWFTEAGLKLRAFTGLTEGFRLIKELSARFWDKGLFPLIEEGPEDRSRPLEWLNEKLAESILELPITRRNDKGDDFTLAQLRAAQRVGSEASFKTKDGDIDEAKKKAYSEALASGGVSMDMYSAALVNSAFEDYESLSKEVEALYAEFKSLEQVIDEKFGEKDAPNLSNLRGVLREIKDEVSNRLEKKRPVSQTAQDGGGTASNGLHFSLPGLGAASGVNGSWHEAEQLIRSGKVDAGLSAMTRLAATETTGRNRFQRKLLLAEICLSSRRKELARAILEELAEQIDKFKLSEWESSDLVGGVWSRLYKIYKAEDGDKDRAKDLFEQLCRLDPWQALNCGD